MTKRQIDRLGNIIANLEDLGLQIRDESERAGLRSIKSDLISFHRSVEHAREAKRGGSN